LRGILSCDLSEDDVPTWMCVEEVGEIVDFVVYYDPEIVFAGML